jgi:L-alanine-DL-glutamate epimerase-like enolase superfamily enzyme
LLDLVARARGVPLRVALGGARPYDVVPVNGLARADRPADELVAEVRACAARGLSAVKVKLRARDEAGFAREVAALVRVRAALPTLELRLDPNASWSLDDAPRRLAALAPVSPRYVEQPVPRGDLARLAVGAVAFAADESLADAVEADAVFAADACAAYVIKPSIVGGVARALGLAARAASLRRGVVVTHAFDGPVGFAVACEVALALGHAPLACGLDPAGVLPPADAARLPQLDVPGVVRGAAAPGLGLRCAP